MDFIYVFEETRLNAQCVKYALIGTVWISKLWDIYLNTRQYRVYASTENHIPEELVNHFKSEFLEKAKAYGRKLMIYNIIFTCYYCIILTICACCNVFPTLWYFVSEDSEPFILSDLDENHLMNTETHSGIFVAVLILLSSIIYIPFALYETFVIEAKFGFNKQTPFSYIKDFILGLIILEIFVPMCTCVIVYMIGISPYLFFGIWVASMFGKPLDVLMYLYVIDPIFNKYKPFPDELKDEVSALTEKVQFPRSKLFIGNSSKRTSHSGAYILSFCGINRIVISDTLLESTNRTDDNQSSNVATVESQGSELPKQIGCNNNEITAVIAHELAHWKYHHIYFQLIILQVLQLFVLTLFALLIKAPFIYEAFGFSEDKPVIVGLIVISLYILPPFISIATFFITTISRHFEFQADRYAHTIGYGPALNSALMKIYKDNLQYPVNDWLYLRWYHGYPTLLERIKTQPENV